MKIKVPYAYTESYVPPRCRKPRDRRVEASITLTIREITAEEAPIAIVHHERKVGDTGVTKIPYRWFDGRLWIVMRFQRYSHAPWETQTAEQFAGDLFGMRLPYYHDGYSQLSNRKTLMGYGRGILFIDGVRYCPAGEPRFCIYTFGLGHNHGGTALAVENHYNPNIGHSRYFRIDQRDLAITTANSIAQGRGDTESTFTDANTDTFDIHIPEALKLHPNKDHGEGDPFINAAEAMIQASPTVLCAALGVVAAARA